MEGCNVFSLMRFLNCCRDHTTIWNLSDKPIELQIRVGSILQKAHTLKPNSSKRVNHKSIYKAYMPGRHKGRNKNDDKNRSLLYYYDESCQPYVWIHDSGCDFTRMVKQQYVSLEDLRDCSEIKIFRDHQRGCISVRKNVRT